MRGERSQSVTPGSFAVQGSLHMMTTAVTPVTASLRAQSLHGGENASCNTSSPRGHVTLVEVEQEEEVASDHIRDGNSNYSADPSV